MIANVPAYYEVKLASPYAQFKVQNVLALLASAAFPSSLGAIPLALISHLAGAEALVYVMDLLYLVQKDEARVNFVVPESLPTAQALHV